MELILQSILRGINYTYIINHLLGVQILELLPKQAVGGQQKMTYLSAITSFSSDASHDESMLLLEQFYASISGGNL